MPLPTPTNDESHDDFISRCMGDDAMVEEFPDEDQRNAVCETQWSDKDENSASPSIERRILLPEEVELRVEKEDGKATRLTGYAAVFNKDSQNLGWFIERIAPGAFANALKTSDVRALKNHDPNLVLGRVPKTLSLVENKRGLRFDIELPDTSTGRDVAEEVGRGDITGCSFAFTVKKEQWEETEDEPDKRTILEFKEIFDVGPVTYPAYPDTTVAARSLDEFRKSRCTSGPEEDPEPKKPEAVTGEDAPTRAERIAKAEEAVKTFEQKQINNQIKLHISAAC